MTKEAGKRHNLQNLFKDIKFSKQLHIQKIYESEFTNVRPSAPWRSKNVHNMLSNS